MFFFQSILSFLFFSLIEFKIQFLSEKYFLLLYCHFMRHFSLNCASISLLKDILGPWESGAQATWISKTSYNQACTFSEEHRCMTEVNPSGLDVAFSQWITISSSPQMRNRSVRFYKSLMLLELKSNEEERKNIPKLNSNRIDIRNNFISSGQLYSWPYECVVLALARCRAVMLKIEHHETYAD